MNLKEFAGKWKDLVATMNKNGVPMPTLRDPKTGKGSISLTLVFISFNFCLMAMAGKWSGFLGGIDPSQALNLFMVCAGLYWGRKFQGETSSLEGIVPQEAPQEEAPPNPKPDDPG